MQGLHELRNCDMARGWVLLLRRKRARHMHLHCRSHAVELGHVEGSERIRKRDGENT